MREILKQPQYKPIRVSEQIAALLAITAGKFDGIPTDRVREAEQALRKSLTEKLGDLCGRIESGEKLSLPDREILVCVADESAQPLKGEAKRADQ